MLVGGDTGGFGVLTKGPAFGVAGLGEALLVDDEEAAFEAVEVGRGVEVLAGGFLEGLVLVAEGLKRGLDALDSPATWALEVDREGVEGEPLKVETVVGGEEGLDELPVDLAVFAGHGEARADPALVSTPVELPPDMAHDLGVAEALDDPLHEAAFGGAFTDLVEGFFDQGFDEFFVGFVGALTALDDHPLAATKLAEDKAGETGLDDLEWLGDHGAVTPRAIGAGWEVVVKVTPEAPVVANLGGDAELEALSPRGPAAEPAIDFGTEGAAGVSTRAALSRVDVGTAWSDVAFLASRFTGVDEGWAG